METLITVINKLQDVMGTVGATEIQLPQIVAVGCQVYKITNFEELDIKKLKLFYFL